jgi:hypothetical protein
MNTPTTNAKWERLCCSGQSWYQIAEEMKLDCRQLESELTTVTEERDRLAEVLRKAISWGDSASHHILHRQDINWTYLNEARETLQSLNQDHFPDVGNMIRTTTTEP